MIGRVANYLRSNLLACVALFVALGGTSFALSGGFVGKGGKISGCVSRKGVLTLAKPGHTCRKGLAAMAWNVSGPAGAPGAPGANGQPGAPGQSITGLTGPTGPSDLYTNKTPGGPLKLPEGDYEVFTKATWHNATAGVQRIDCGMRESAQEEEDERGIQSIPAEGYGTVSLVLPLHLSHSETINLECVIRPNENGEFVKFQLNALRVGSLHAQ
jgi:hypothetical protein